MALDAKKLHPGVPGGGLVGQYAHLEQGFDEAKQPVEHLGRGEVGFDFLLAVGVARLAQLLADVGPVPGLGVGQIELFGGKGAQVGQVALGPRPGTRRQLAQKGAHLLGAVGHFGRQRDGGVVRVAQQLRFLVAQGQNLRDQGAVVEARRLGGGVGGGIALAQLAGAGGVGAVEALAQVALARKLHQRQIAGQFEAEQVAAGVAGGLGGGAGGGQHIGRHAIKFFGAGQVLPGLGGVEQVFAEFLLQLGQLLLNGGKARLVRALQFGPAKHEVAQGVLARLGLLGRQARRV